MVHTLRCSIPLNTSHHVAIHLIISISPHLITLVSPHLIILHILLCLKEVQLLGKKYFLISSAHLDTFCEWVYRNRSMCTSQENVVALLGGGNGQHTYFFSQALRKEANHLDASYKSFEKEMDHVDLISHNPVCIEWQISKCNSL